MNTLTDKEWIYLSQSLYRLYQTETYNEFCDVFWKQTRRIIPCSKAIIFKIRIDNDKIIRSSARLFPDNKSFSQVSKFLQSDIIGSSQELLFSPWSSVFRQSDIYPLSEWQSSDLYKNFWEEDQVYYGLNAALIHKDLAVASIELFRDKDSRDFSEKDVYILDILKDHLALKIYQLDCEENSNEAGTNVNRLIYEKASEAGLTKRETEIIIHLCKGEERTDICKNLYISGSTLRKHISNIYNKLSINSFAQLMIWYRENLIF